MYKLQPSIIVTPVLAGNVQNHTQLTIADASGIKQNLKKAPKKLCYKNMDVPFSAPDYDSIVQVLGKSMEKFGLDNGDILLTNEIDHHYHLEARNKILVKMDADGVHEDWLCLREVVSINDNQVTLKSIKNSKLFEETLDKDKIIAIAVYKIPMPEDRPSHIN